MGRIHPTAIIEDGARLGAEVEVGPFSIIGPEVVIEDSVSVGAHAVIEGRTRIGARTKIGSFAALGGEAQDLSATGEDTAVEIGPDCIIREYANVHRGTRGGRGVTTIGANCFMMIGSHVAHDCVVGEHVILTNQATLGGHTEIGDYAILGGLAAVQQRQRVGAHTFVAGLAGVRRDIVPFAMAYGWEARLAGINVRGLSRRGFSRADITRLRAAYRAFFSTKEPRAERLAAVAEEFGGIPAVDAFVDFIRASGNRPLALPREVGDRDDAD